MGQRFRYVCCLVVMLVPIAGWAQQPEERCIALELYVRGDPEQSAITEWAQEAVEARRGVSLRVFDITEDAGRARYEAICTHFKRDQANSVPMLYGCAQVIVAPRDQRELERALDELRTMTVFVRYGCPRCAQTKEYLSRLQPRYPGFRLVYRDVVRDRGAQSELNEVTRRYKATAVSVPVFHFCDQILVGWNGAEGTGRRLQSLLDRWTFTCKKRTAALHPLHDSRHHRPLALSPRPPTAGDSVRGKSPGIGVMAAALPGAPVWDAAWLIAFQEAEHRPRDEGETAEPENDFVLPLPPPPADVEAEALPLPAEADEATSQPSSIPAEDEINVPLLGRIRASELGLPAFTIAIGLVDGFNPCAMWVLLFLLSILVNLQDRWKIVAVAGSFVVVSGAVYFAFMAAWLNAVALVGFERPVQIALGTLALLIGSIHVKDFFAFKKGISLSIPESARPGIAARVRRIVMAESVVGAIIGAGTLAVLVNMLELLCTAGLPALYTAILQQQGIEGWLKYTYLGLYNLAYMFDDSLMVILAVVTLDKMRLQEKQGRWLKLVSGLFVLALGVIMLVRPNLLRFI